MYVSLTRLIKLTQSKRKIAVYALAAILTTTGSTYGYMLFQHKPTPTSQVAVTDNAGKDIPAESDQAQIPSATEEVLEDDGDEPKPASTTTTTQPQATGGTNVAAPQVHYPESLNISEVRASGDAFCDDTTYKLTIRSAIIFSNGQQGTVGWQIEGLRSGALEIVASGSIQFSKNQHVYELPLYNRHYMTQPIGMDTGIRFRVTSPDIMSSQWIFPSENLPGESPCAGP